MRRFVGIICLLVTSVAVMGACSDGEQGVTVTGTPAPEPGPARFDGRGPYEVGVTTIDLGDRLAEVWYPVDPGDEGDAATEQFDGLSVFPESLQSFIPEQLQSVVDTGAYRDVPASGDGPFPVVLFSHGFGSYRQANIRLDTHLASWGLVVAAPDHLERGIAAQSTNTLTFEIGMDVRDLRATLAAVEGTTGGPLGGAVDGDARAVIGYSAGAYAAVRLAVQDPDLTALVAISGGTTGGERGIGVPGQRALVLAAGRDTVVPTDVSRTLYADLDAPKRLLVISEAGHASFSDACARIAELGGLGDLEALIGAEQVARAENGCTDDYLDPAVVDALAMHVVTAELLDAFGLEDATAALDAAALRTVADVEMEYDAVQ